MKRALLISLIGGIFYICLMLLWGRQYQILTVHAKEVKENMENIENGYLSLDEESTEDSDTVLHDYKGNIEVDENTDGDSITEDNTEDTERIDVSENSTEDGENLQVMNDDQFRIMIIFCFGLSVGVIVGHFLTGFIK